MGNLAFMCPPSAALCLFAGDIFSEKDFTTKGTKKENDTEDTSGQDILSSIRNS